MRLSAVPFISVLAFHSVTAAVIPGVDKLATDLTSLVTSLTATPIDINKISTNVRVVVSDTLVLALGAGGINTGGSLTASNATAVVTQITTDLCPSLSTVKGATASLPAPINTLSLLLTSSLSTAVNLLRTLLRQLPAGVDVTAAITCLNNIAPATSSIKMARAGGATIPGAS